MRAQGEGRGGGMLLLPSMTFELQLRSHLIDDGQTANEQRDEGRQGEEKVNGLFYSIVFINCIILAVCPDSS